LGLTARNRFVASLVDTINNQYPDILVCTGDFIDGKVDHLPEMADLFNQIHARYGKYAVTGNHEFYVGLDDSLKFFQRSGFKVLRSESEKVGSIMNIVGVDYFSENNPTSDALLLSKIDNGLFTLFLKHRPDVEKEALGLFDLQLSGHTHGGQIFPFNFLVSRRFPFISGYYGLQKGSGLYTSRGTGTWGPQMRILSPPEITVVKLTGKTENRPAPKR
jgi:predicted MPP superfamily phosphohydrolase